MAHNLGASKQLASYPQQRVTVKSHCQMWQGATADAFFKLQPAANDRCSETHSYSSKGLLVNLSAPLEVWRGTDVRGAASLRSTSGTQARCGAAHGPSALPTPTCRPDVAQSEADCESAPLLGACALWCIPDATGVPRPLPWLLSASVCVCVVLFVLCATSHGTQPPPADWIRRGHSVHIPPKRPPGRATASSPAWPRHRLLRQLVAAVAASCCGSRVWRLQLLQTAVRAPAVTAASAAVAAVAAACTRTAQSRH
eukprot:358340-Chlamydomonas_euryale.AAC.5